MNQEIERKFLVVSDGYRALAEPVYVRQGYLCRDPERVVRVRIYGEMGFLTIKGANRGITRAEFEYPIPRDEATLMLEELCLKPDIEKFRYRIPFEGHVWEVDEFRGANEGLVIAEIELPDEATPFAKPDWVGEEVSGDARYYNSNLISRPFGTW
jgi:adenylate cyclase